MTTRTGLFVTYGGHLRHLSRWAQMRRANACSVPIKPRMLTSATERGSQGSEAASSAVVDIGFAPPPRVIHGLRSGSLDAIILLTNPNLQLGCMHTIHARRFVIRYTLCAFVLYMYLSGRGDRACSVVFPPLLNITPCGASCWSSHERSPLTGSGRVHEQHASPADVPTRRQIARSRSVFQTTNKLPVTTAAVMKVAWQIVDTSPQVAKASRQPFEPFDSLFASTPSVDNTMLPHGLAMTCQCFNHFESLPEIFQP